MISSPWRDKLNPTTPRSEGGQLAEYTPGSVRRWVTRWGELCALAESPRTAHGLLHDGPTAESPRIGARQKGTHGDSLHYATMRADLESAWRRLDGLPYQVVWIVMQGMAVSVYATFIHRRDQDVRDAFHLACRQMATHLGWRDQGDNGDHLIGSGGDAHG